MDFGFENCCLHNLLMQTRLEPAQVPEKLFSMSFGEAKVRHGDRIFQKHIFVYTDLHVFPVFAMFCKEFRVKSGKDT